MMAEDIMLSELCAICHFNLPKYKCPNCAIKTCSVVCVKRHKARSHCSGTRDPATYRKRKELSTSSSVDQDYNFITRVERGIGRMTDKTEDLGLNLSHHSAKRAKGEARRDAELQQRGPTVIKAPPGLSRARQNNSKWDNRHKCLIWTIEWILEDGSKSLGNCQEIRSVQQAFMNAVGNRKSQKHQGRSLDNVERGKGIQSDNQTPDSADLAQKASPPSPLERHFYLHRPNVPSDVRCVIPIQPEAIIKDIVCDRLLIEFPSIFVLNRSPERLEAPFVIEEHYLNGPGGEKLPATSSILNDSPQRNTSISEEAPIIDEKQLLEVMQKDLG